MRGITSHLTVTGLWISVDAVEKPVRACSSCAGDYEDPDRTGWEEETDEDEEQEVER